MDNSSAENTALSTLTEKQLSQALAFCADQIQRAIKTNNEIEKVYNKVFIIKSSDIRQVYDLVSQRLQNDADKISSLNFAITVASTQENFRKYLDIDSFINDIETRDIEPVNIQLEWSLLVRFSEKASYEKQTINIIMTKPDYDESNDFEREFVFVYKGRPIIGNGAIIISIENTNKIWALDILAHIENWISKNVKKPTIDKKNQILYENRRLVKKIVKFSAEIFPYILFLYASIRIYITGSNQMLFAKEFSFYTLVCSILIVYNFIEKKIADIFAFKVSNIVAGLLPRSFFILSSEDNDKYEELLKETKGKGRSAWRNIIFPIIINLISSAIFIVCFEKFLK